MAPQDDAPDDPETAEAQARARLAGLRARPADMAAVRAARMRRDDEAQARAALEALRARPVRPPGQQLGRMVRQAMRAAGVRPGRGIESIRAMWSEIVGAELAPLCSPEKLSRERQGATLTLRVSPAAAPIVLHEHDALLERLAAFAGPGRIARLAIVQGAVRPAGTRRPVPLPPELDAAGEARLRAEIPGLSDAALAEALMAYGRAMARARLGRRPPPGPD